MARVGTTVHAQGFYWPWPARHFAPALPGRLIIRNGNNVEAPPVYDSYEVEYLPIEGLLSTGRHFFVELTTDSSGAAAGMALRYEGTGPGHRGHLSIPAPPWPPQTFTPVPTAFEQGHCYEPFVKYGNFTASDPRYPVGTTVEFTCDPGYTLEQGSTIIECVDPNDPQWNETEPACRGGHRGQGDRVLEMEVHWVLELGVAVGAGAGDGLQWMLEPLCHDVCWSQSQQGWRVLGGCSGCWTRGGGCQLVPRLLSPRRC